jgi:hypothetical protein
MRKVFSRSRLWALLPALILLGIGISPAHATTINNGGTKTGTVTGSRFDSYSFSADAGSAFIVSVGETGNHTDGFVPEIALVRPDGLDGVGQARAFSSLIEQDNVAEGPWTVKVTRLDGGNNGGAYDLRLIKIPGATGAALTGADSSGTISRGGVNVYTFTGTAGRSATVTLTKTGDNGFIPQADVFAPSGAYAGGISCPENCAQEFALAAGTYTVVVSKADGSDVTGTYTLSVSGN